MISFFWALVLTHLVGDFLLQHEKHALEKSSSFSSLLAHCSVYSVLFAPVLFVYGASLWWLAWIFGTHLAVDNGRFVRWWSRVVNGNEQPPFWLLVVRDQVLHLLVLAVVAW